MKCITAQSDYNSLPLVTGWNSLVKVQNQEITGTLTLGQVLDFLQQDSNQIVRDFRETTLEVPSAEDIIRMIAQDPSSAAAFGLPPEFGNIAALLTENLSGDPSAADVPAEGADDSSAGAAIPDEAAAPQTVSIGEIVDTVASVPVIQKQRDKSYAIRVKISDLINMFGREKLEAYVKEQTRLSNYNAACDNDKDTIMTYWFHIGKFVLLFAALAVISLEFVDKDKR